MTVRATEALVKKVQTSQTPAKTPSRQTKMPDVAKLETHLGELLGAPVSIDHGQKGKGKLTIRYTSLEELDGILHHIK
jgi:ParB family chromosome partitioning protein